MVKSLANWWNTYIYCTPLNWKLTMNTPPMHVLWKCAEWTYVLHTCRSWFFSICHPASRPNSHSLSYSGFFTWGLSLVDIQLGPERNTREEARVLFLCVSSCLVLCLGQLLHLFKSGTFAGQPQPAFNGQYMPGSDVFSSCLILPGNRHDLMLWQVSRRLPHLFPQVCQWFLSVVHCLKISLWAT